MSAAARPRRRRPRGAQPTCKPRATATRIRIWLAYSPADPTVVYATVEAAGDAQGFYRSNDGGETWEKRSGYIAQPMYYGEIFADPKDADRVYAIDVLNQVTDDGGATWRRGETFPGVPDMTYVADLTPSVHDPDVVYAAFNNHKMGDFKPYLLKSGDRGRTWTSIAGNLPGRGSACRIRFRCGRRGAAGLGAARAVRW